MTVGDEGASPGRCSAAPAPKRVTKRGYWLPGLIALTFLILAALVINFVGLRHTDPRMLHGRDVETQLAENLQAVGGSAQPPEVSCPSSEPVRKGLVFTCVVHRGSGLSTLVVTETDNRGAYKYAPEGP